VQFKFDTGDPAANNFEGWYIDDITVRGNNLPPPPPADQIPPSVPAGLVGTSTASTVMLKWAPSTDNVDVAGYAVYRAGVQVGTSATTTYTDSSLAANTSYGYVVSAFDAAGNKSAKSATTTVKTLPPPPPPVDILTNSVSNLKATSATINWTANVAATGSITYKTGNTTKTVTDNTAKTSHAQNISSLVKNSVYTYTITAKANGTTDTVSGTFTTPAR
jgi:hypothetical protein